MFVGGEEKKTAPLSVLRIGKGKDGCRLLEML